MPAMISTRGTKPESTHKTRRGAKLDIRESNCLLDELKKLAEAGETADFSLFDPDIEALPAGERETARLLKRVLDKYKAASEYGLMRYKLTGESLGVGYWDIEITDGNPINPDNKFKWSPELRRLLGYRTDSKDFSGTLGNWITHIHPEDRAMAIKDYTAHTADRAGKTQFIAEYRLRKTDGAYISVRAFGTALRDGAGLPIRIAGAVEDITESRNVQEALFHRDATLDMLNRVALVLLTREEKSFDIAMAEGLSLIAGIADIDRMSVFRNSEKPDGLHISQIYRWLKEKNGTVDVWNELRDVPFANIAPELLPALASGECVCGQVSRLPVSEVFALFGCVTVLAIPMFSGGKFWGMALFERLTEENFTERETDVLRSASIMLANAVIRNEEAELVRQANEQSRLMLDAAPIAVTMWDKDFNVVDCSQSAISLFGFTSKQELTERLMNYAPEYQPCGRLSVDILVEAATEAFRTGSYRLEWTHTTTGGDSIVFDATAVRVKYHNEYALMLYSRDIREEKKMLAKLAARDEELAAQAHWYKSLLDGIPLPLCATDADMKLTFTNSAAETFFGRSREELVGNHCSVFNCAICNTENCGVVRARQGQAQTFFKMGDRSCKIDTEIIRDTAGKTIGHLEILHDVTEVENLARRQADAENEAKSTFLAQMSHEMRTPLNAVIGLSELVLENGTVCQENEVYIDKIYNAGSTLLNIVNDILDISKIEAGKFEIIPQDYDVPSLINDTITQNILRIHSKPVRFTLNISENTPTKLRGDDVRVRQILSNLLSNAFKYTDEGTVDLDIDYERENGGDSVWTTFRIKDTGIGIRPEDLARLFGDYTRLDGESNRKIGGTGLGLSITKRLVELMGGSVAVESQYGEGSVFTARFRQQFVTDSVIGGEMAEHLKKFSYTSNRRRVGAQLERIHMPNTRVLVVDDNLTNLDIARGLMRPYGMAVDCMTNGQDAVDAIRAEKYKYDAVFMDHMMPGMDGMEAVRIIREEIGTEYAKTVPVIALTANAVTGNRERFISQGFNAFVSKPIDIFRLDAVIKTWVYDKKKDSLLTADSRVFVERQKRQDRRSGDERRKRDAWYGEEERRNGFDRRSADGRRNIDENRGTDEGRVSDKINCLTGAPFCEVVEGLDWVRGMELFGGEDSYRDVLRSFAVNTRPLLKQIERASDETLLNYAITVHGIKSSGRGIGAYALGSMAESLEFAAKDENIDYVIRHNPDFIEAARKLICDIETVLGKNTGAGDGGGDDGGGDGGGSGAKKKKERPGDTELARLRAACESYDMDEIEVVMGEIESCEYTTDGGLVEWLSENVARLNYSEIIEKITFQLSTQRKV